jgi:phospholipid transport system substrate-binding protein
MPLLSPSLWPITARADNGEVRNVVEGLNTTLLDVMQSADELGYDGRYEKLEPSLRATFDFEFMTKIAVGRAWNDFDADQRQRLVERFARMSIATFASRFDGYSGERFEIVGEEPGRRNTIVVNDQIIRPDDPPVGLNFVLREEADPDVDPGWRIIDVMLDGKFSELARQRAEFSSVLERGGYDDLLAALDSRIEALRVEG